MSIIIDFITDLGLEIVKERISDIVTLNIVKGRIEEFLKQQLSLNYNITREEEVDFGGLAEYIRCNLLDDVKKRCFGKKEERRMARKRIMENAVSYASAHTIISAKRTMKIVGDCVDILAEYYRSKVNRELLFVAGEIEDCIVEENEETRALITEERKHLEDVILENTALSVDHSIRKIESGKIYEVENKIGTFMNAISSEHTLFPDYGFRMTKDNKLTSVALNDEAKIKYPEKFKITASSVKLCDKLVHDSGKNIFDQAYRHQLPIYIEVENAQKYLGDFLDPIQTEAEEMIGSQAIMKPPEFPPAFPCCVKIGIDIVVPFLLLRVKEILDDGKIVITNEEQHNYPFKINIKISPNANKLSFTVTPFNPTNREYLNYKTFLRRVMNDEKVSLWLLDRNERFIQGTLDYSADENLYEEIEFLQKIVAIEEYFETTINIPNSITAGEHAVINRLYDLIQGGYKGNLDKFDFSFELCDENRPRLLSLTETDYVLGYSAEGTFSIFNQKLIVPIFREIECVKVENLGRLKEKIRILDNGDQVKIVYVPGTGKKTCDYVDRIKTEEIENGLLFSKEH